jgi:hypothetical protein
MQDQIIVPETLFSEFFARIRSPLRRVEMPVFKANIVRILRLRAGEGQ